MKALYFMETFPSGSEWAHYIPGCPLVGNDGPYLSPASTVRKVASAWCPMGGANRSEASV